MRDLSMHLRLCQPAFARVWCLLLLIFISVTSNAQTLDARVNTNSITLSDTLQLTVSLDASSRDTPDFSALGADFDVLNTSTMNNRSIINGSIRVQTSWTLLLAPKREGRLLIPSFNLGNAISEAIEINVSQTATNGQPHPVSFESQLDITQAHLQQQILLTLRLKINTSFTLSAGNLEPLNIKDAIVVGFDERRSEINEGGVRYDLREYQYAIFPQASGELVIPSQLLQLELSTNRFNNRSWFNQNAGSVQRFRTQEQRVTILPAPQDTRATPWVPAKSLSLRQHLSAAPEAMIVGEPITRTITLAAEGLTGAQLPSLPTIAIEHLNAYQDQAQIDDQKDQQGVIGSRIETTALVATRAGDYTLPGIRVNWWNTHSQTFEVAELAPITLKVNAKFGASDADDYAPAEPNGAAPSAAGQSQQGASATGNWPTWIMYLLGLSLAGNLGFILHWLIRGRRAKEAQIHARRMQDAASHARAQDERDAWHALKQQLKQPQAASLRGALLTWLSLKSGQSVMSLEQAAGLLDDADARQQLRLIDAALFGKEDLAALDVDCLEAALKRLRAGHTRAATGPAPLYPE